MGLMRRRGLLTLGSDIDWDLEWDYTMGLLENNGWTKDTSGTSSSSALTSDGEKLVSGSSGSNAYVRLNPPDAYKTMTSGIIEVVASCTYRSGNSNSTGRNSQNLRVALSNGTNGIATFINGDTSTTTTGQGLKMQTNAYPYNGEYLAPWESGSTHTIRLVLDNGVGEVWLDGILIKSNVSSSIITNTIATRIWSQNALGDSYPSYIKSVKLKKYS